MLHVLMTAVLLLGQVDAPLADGGPRWATYSPEPNAAEQIVHPSVERPFYPASGEQGAGGDGSSFAGRAPLPLARPSAASPNDRSDRQPPSAGRSVATVVSSLAIVLGVFFAAMWLMRRGAPAGSAALPSEVVQVLGRAALSPKQQLQLVRVGEKLLLLAVSAGGAQTLTEVTDPEEVHRLAAACEAARTASAAASFRQVLAQLGKEPAAGGFFGRTETAADAAPQSRRGRTAEEEAHA